MGLPLHPGPLYIRAVGQRPLLSGTPMALVVTRIGPRSGRLQPPVGVHRTLLRKVKEFRKSASGQPNPTCDQPMANARHSALPRVL